ncbi:hypothetical protein DFH06DRAFT_1297222 [Mycena polygramma]|nr:hypothetical protein DFH06DRAFT_1297222 [Mycena polygramma]
MSSSATFCGTPISTRFDDSAASCVSLDWVLDSGIPTRGSCLSGLLKLSSNAGAISIFLPNVPVAASLPCDLVLGLDWVQLVRKLAQDVVVHLNSGSLDFRRPDSAVAQSSSTASLTPVPVSQVNIGARFSAFSVSTSGPGTAPPSSLMPSTEGINFVTPEVPPHTREARTSRTRGGISSKMFHAGHTRIILFGTPRCRHHPGAIQHFSIWHPGKPGKFDERAVAGGEPNTFPRHFLGGATAKIVQCGLSRSIPPHAPSPDGIKYHGTNHGCHIAPPGCQRYLGVPNRIIRHTREIF